MLKVSLGYSTRYYNIPSSIQHEWGTVITESDPEQGVRAGMLWRIENDTAGVLLFNAGGNEYPSTDPDEFQKQIVHLFASDEIADLVDQLEPLQGHGDTVFPSQFVNILNLWSIGLRDYLCLAMHSVASIRSMAKA